MANNSGVAFSLLFSIYCPKDNGKHNKHSDVATNYIFYVFGSVSHYRPNKVNPLCLKFAQLLQLVFPCLDYEVM